MNKKTLSKDFDIFGDMSAPAEGGAPADEAKGTADISDSIFGALGGEEPKADAESPEEDTPKEDAPAEQKEPEAEGDKGVEPNEEPEADPGTTEDDEAEILRLIEEASAQADDLGNDPSISDESKAKIMELSDTLADAQATIESLTRQLEVAREQTNKNLEEGEEMRIYKPMIQKLEKDPQLMMFCKYYGTKDDAMKSRLTDIAKDMIYALSGIDVFEAFEKKQTDTAMGFGSSSDNAAAPSFDSKREEPKKTKKGDGTFPF